MNDIKGNNRKFADIPYTRPDFERIRREIDILTEEMEKAHDFETVKRVIKARDELQQEISVAEGILYARSFHDVTDEYYQAEFQTVMTEIPMLNTEKLDTAILNSDFGSEIDELYGTHLRELMSLGVRTKSSGKELQAKEAELQSRYEQKRASMRYKLDGAEVSEGELSKAFVSHDRDLRRRAFEASNQAYIDEANEFTAIIKELVHTRNALARENGFDNYMEYGNLLNCRLGYGHKELTEFIEAVRLYIVPIYKELQEEQRKRLGLDSLMPYDTPLIFPEGNAKPVEGEAALAQAAKNMYHALSPEAGEFFDEMLTHDMMDVGFSVNKISGMGFCTDIPGSIKMPFVFANSNGTASDVSVYTHELGHAFQSYLSMRTQPLVEYYNGGPDLNEIHSKTMELFAYPFAESFFGADAERFLTEHRYGIVKEICAFCQRYAFESYLYEHEDASIAEWAAENDKIAKSFGRNLYNGPWMDKVLRGCDVFEDMSIISYPLYVISYALSQVCALQLKECYDKDAVEGWKRYRTLCAEGGSETYIKILQDAGIMIPFTAQAVENAAHTLRKLIWQK